MARQQVTHISRTSQNPLKVILDGEQRIPSNYGHSDRSLFNSLQARSLDECSCNIKHCCLPYSYICCMFLLPVMMFAHILSSHFLFSTQGRTWLVYAQTMVTASEKAASEMTSCKIHQKNSLTCSESGWITHALHARLFFMQNMWDVRTIWQKVLKRFSFGKNKEIRMTKWLWLAQCILYY